MAWSDLIKQLTAGFDLHTNREKKYGPVYHDGRPIAEVQLLENGTERIWLKEPNAASAGLFTVTRSTTWKGGVCTVTKETVKACRKALMLAVAGSPPGAK
jgi:hypothetical protein